MRRLPIGLLLLVAGCGGSVAASTTATHPHRGQAARSTTSAITTPPATKARTARGKPRPNLARELGQMIVARFRGPTPSAAFLSRIRTGQIGGVILFGDNVAGGVDATRRLTTLLQSAATEGGHPPLLVMADQEGGPVKRLPGPPALAAADMTSPALATAQGRATGRLLRSAGVNLDVAPVADVERSPNFLGTRSFGSSPGLVGARACAFAQGLASQGVAYTLKHFPGLGLATGNTDLGSVAVSAPAATLRAGYRAYRLCGHGPLALVMISSARYPGLAASLPAVMSPAIYRRELPLAIRGSLPVTISDDLQSPAIESQDAPARHAIDAGLDLLLYAQTEQASADAYGKLLDELSSGVISPDHLRVANRLIEALKSHLGH